MSVIIKNMTAPKSCHTCKLMLLSPCQCALTGKSYNWGLDRRPSDCPLIELPPHGRLIDADELNLYDISPAYGMCVIGVTEEDIELADTVIEAEGETDA